MNTGFGRSGKTYGNELIPHQGSRQGNRIGPTLWALISTKLIMTVFRKRHEVEVLSATTLALLSIVCFTFDNDMDLPITGQKNRDIIERNENR